jgi:hypothetical protein
MLGFRRGSSVEEKMVAAGQTIEGFNPDAS